MKHSVPIRARAFLSRLNEAGYPAYLVGGAVRDLLSGGAISDLDLTTRALPEEVRAVFSDGEVIETGLSHGTLTVLLSGERAEITTFRREGAYSDLRHPDGVTFVRDVEEDLARRDFTVNAMALSADGDLIDPFGGREDLEKGILRAVGDAEKRFSEDALRILRGLRLCSEHGFVLEENTRSAARRKRDNLKKVSRERRFSEFCRLLCGKDVCRVLIEEPEIVCTLVPEIAPTIGFDQHNFYHCFPLLEHVAHTVGAAEKDRALRLSAFYHDIAKPQTFVMGEDGCGHFPHHAEQSARICEKSLTDLGAPKALVREVVALVRDHDDPLIPDEAHVKGAILRYGEARLNKLIALKRADYAALDPDTSAELKRELCAFERLLSDVLKREDGLSLQKLAVSGDDLLALGLSPSPEVGALLKRLLEAVADGRAKNCREDLLALVAAWRKNGK